MDDIDADHLAELEANLYAQIHHDAPESVQQYTAAEKLNPPTLQHQQKNATASRIVTSSSVNNQPTAAPNTKRGRYWSEAVGGGGHFAKPPNNTTPSSIGQKKRFNPFSSSPSAKNTSPTHTAPSNSGQQPPSFATSSDGRPKPFTPYTSYLSQIGTPCVVDSTPSAATASPTTNLCSDAMPETLAAATVSPNVANDTNTNPIAAAPTGSYQSTRAINPVAAVLSQRRSRRQRQKERRNMGHTAGQLQQLDRARSQMQQELHQRGIGPLRQAGGKLKKAHELRCKQERATGARALAKQQQQQQKQNRQHTVFIDLDSDAAVDDSDADSDEVICIPVPPPPLVCIDDSSEDDQSTPQNDASTANDKPNADDDDSSMTEDFVGRRDRDRLSLCHDGDNDDDALVAAALDSLANSDAEIVCATVDDAIREQNRRQNDDTLPETSASARKVLATVDTATEASAAATAASSSTTTTTTTSDSAEQSPSTCEDAVAAVADRDATVFATPKRSRSNRSAAAVANQSYEVADNCFAAVDVYESESSDFPESVYEKGRPTGGSAVVPLAADVAVQEIDTDSDVSSIQLNTTNRAKRRKKRRSSCNTSRGSDQKSSDDDDKNNDDDDDDDEPNTSNEGPAFVDILRNTSTPYIQRGEAVANAKSKPTRIPPVPPKRRRSQTGKGKSNPYDAAAAAAAAAAQSDDEFMSMLSCIVHDNSTTAATATPSTEPTAEHVTANANNSSDMLAEKTIDARAIVENVLSKVAKNKKTKNSGVQNSSTSNAWKVTDDVVSPSAESASATAAATTSSGTTDEPTTSKKANKKRSTGSVEGKSTDAFFVVDSVGESDPIPSSSVIVSATDTEGGASTSGRLRTKTADVVNAVAVAPRADGNTHDTIVRSTSVVVDDPEMCWNDEMRCFYNKSWGGQDYDQSELMRRMPRNRQEWPIAEADLFPSAPQQTRRFNRSQRCCYNCREEGHRAAECHQPPKAVRCYMCGQSGHREPRCPNTICLRCGTRTKVFARSCQRCQSMANVHCPLCKAKGHASRDCPDKWRRYHSTTKANTPLTKQPIIVNKPKWCCVCASPGHLGVYCRNAIRIMETPAQPIKIQSYEESYLRINAQNLKPDGSQLDDVAPYALFSEPQPHYNFAWRINESADRIYGRMLDATQPQRPLFERVSKKRKKSRSESAATSTGDDAAVTSREKTPRTEFSALDGTKLVLNPLCASIVRNPLQQEQQLDDNADQAIAEAMECLDDEPMTCADQLDDTFDKIVDLSVVDEAVRQHMEGTSAATPPTQRTVKSFQVTVPNTSVGPVTRSVQQSEITLADDNSANNVQFSFDSVSTLENNDGDNATYHSNPSQESTASQDDRPSTPPPPIISALAEAAASVAVQKRTELETEMRRLDKEEAYLKKLKDNLVTTAATSSATSSAKKRTATVSAGNKARRISEPTVAEFADESAIGYHVELNENVDDAAAAATSGGTHYDSDSNYSFSEYFKHSDGTTTSAPTRPSTSKDQATVVQSLLTAKVPETAAAPDAMAANANESIRLPDFIPIDAARDETIDTDDNSTTDDEDNIYDDNAAGDNTSLADSTTNTVTPSSVGTASRYSEAKIYLSKDHSKYLMTRQGTFFLTETYIKHDVKLRMEWCSIGNILIVQGLPTAQDSFHADLLAYCTKAETDMRKKQEISQQVPKNRHTLIRFIKEQIAQLEQPLGNVRDCFQRMLTAEQQCSKAGTKSADRARKLLNMILLGQTGLREGAMHLTALQSNLRCLVETETKDVISTVFRNEVFQHFKYIFSSVPHDNYAAMVREYEDLRRSNRLPALLLDRKLIGLRISVGDVVVTVPSSGSDNAAAPLTEASTVAKVVDQPNSGAEDVTVPLVDDDQQKLSTSTSVGTSSKDSRPVKLQTPKKSTANQSKSSKVTDDLMTIAGDADSGETTRDATAETGAGPSAGARTRDACASALWSLKCQQYVDKCRAIPKIKNNASAMSRLLQVEAKARDNRLSYTDYRMLMKIFEKCV